MGSALDLLASMASPPFAAVVGNPPYQRNVSGSSPDRHLRNASKSVPVYHDFIDVLRAGQPQRFSLIVPAKWYTGGWGLDSFRRSMLEDPRVASLVDFRASEHVFVGTAVNGGLSVLHWEKAKTSVEVKIWRFGMANEALESSTRPVGSPDRTFFLRDHQAIKILKKTGSLSLSPDQSFTSVLLGATPYGIPSNYTDHVSKPSDTHGVPLLRAGRAWTYCPPGQASANLEHVECWRVFIPLSHAERSASALGPTSLAPPGSLCTHSYLSTTGLRSESEAESLASYACSFVFRFLVAQLKISPIATRQVYRLVPLLPWDRIWTDDEIFNRFKITEKQQRYVISQVGSAMSALPPPLTYPSTFGPGLP